MAIPYCGSNFLLFQPFHIQNGGSFVHIWSYPSHGLKSPVLGECEGFYTESLYIEKSDIRDIVKFLPLFKEKWNSPH